tara:strand:- start:1166 stop:1504 length:339 start_codon:yes stop_codon:yes gene_type:complete
MCIDLSVIRIAKYQVELDIKVHLIRGGCLCYKSAVLVCKAKLPINAVVVQIFSPPLPNFLITSASLHEQLSTIFLEEEQSLLEEILEVVLVQIHLVHLAVGTRLQILVVVLY